jgi:hypothetical protein
MIWNRAMKTSRLRSIREYVDVKGVVEKVAESGLGKRGNLDFIGMWRAFPFHIYSSCAQVCVLSRW